MKLQLACLIISLDLLLSVKSLQAQDLLLADFESERYEKWTTTGDCFGTGPAMGTLPGQMHVDGFRGKRLVNSFLKGDGSTGTLTSTEFTIQRKYIAFLIGGGNNQEKLALQLIIDGQVARKSTGPNSQPGGTETLIQDSWDVAEFVGKVGTLRIVDEALGGWGHINVDHIVQTDSKPAGLQSNVERQVIARSKYLLIPIRNGAPKRKVTCLVDGRQVVKNEMELADDQADWWAPMDISVWRGKKVTLIVDKLPPDSASLSNIKEQDTLEPSDGLYREPMRGQFHFSPKRGWNNDPNGLVHYNGEYHMFFQHNPYGWGWGNMHWGHAASRDLVRWEEVGDVLMPDELGPMFSGSAVVDWKNTSGFGKDGQPPLVLIYTAAGNPTVQCLAYSLDGRTFTKYAENPVLAQVTGGNRDPKVFWHQPTQKWIMVLYVEIEKKHTIHFFSSSNLKDWALTSVTVGDPQGKRFLFECPDFFELAVDNDPANKKWVLTAADSTYAIGNFDGKQFEAEHERLIGHQGQGFYAAQTFSDLPSGDGRRIQVGWFQTETRGMPFNQSMTIPLELRLISTASGPRMTFAPIQELQSLRGAHTHYAEHPLKPGGKIELPDYELLELRTEIAPGSADVLTIEWRGSTIEYLRKTEQLRIGDRSAQAPLRNGLLRLTIYGDRTGLEIFASDGLCYMPLPINFAADKQKLTIDAHGGPAEIKSLDIYKLNSAWPK